MEKPSVEMPRYQCHKKVWALKIKKINCHTPSFSEDTIIPEESGYAPFAISSEWADKHTPAAGGYFVVYDDGYQSYSPAKAFEEGYTRI